MQNSFEPGDKLRSFLWRFPFLWLVFIAATMDSSSLLRLPIRYAARALTLFNTLNLNDANSVQLQWLQYKALEIMGDVKPMNSFLSTIQSRGTSLDQVMAGYYDEGHPILEGFAREKPRT